MYRQIARKRTGRRKRRTEQGYISQNKIKLIRGGNPYFDQLLHMINTAEQNIQLQVYIFDDDDTGQKITSALKDAAKRNVAVYLMADGYASQKLSKKFIRDLEEAGV